MKALRPDWLTAGIELENGFDVTVGSEVIPFRLRESDSGLEVIIEEWHLTRRLDRMEQKLQEIAREIAVVKERVANRADAQSSPSREFKELAERWRRETALLASVHRIILHPAYQRIIGLGPAVVPLILKELSDKPEHWFWALHALTGEDPVERGATFKEAVDAWVNWGRANNFI